jgi:hypothetical protein
MEMCLKRNFDFPIRALEIGTWFGTGSTQLWLKNLPPKSSIVLIDSWCQYVSSADLSEGKNVAYCGMNGLSFAALHNTLKMVCAFEKNNKDISITTIRGKSYEVLDTFASDLFDFIYIDGSHYYEDVRRDIVCAKRLAKKEYSIICGDDYDLEYGNALIDLARQNMDRDFIPSPSGLFHPGVLLAVYEEFGRVNMKNGFWWVFVKDGRFTCDNLLVASGGVK